MEDAKVEKNISIESDATRRALKERFESRAESIGTLENVSSFNGRDFSKFRCCIRVTAS